MKFTDDRPYITICTDCRDDSNRFYQVYMDGKWHTMEIIDLSSYRILVKYCPICQKKRDEAFEKAQRKPRMSEKDRILRSWGHNPTGSI
jgi:hypothetical protein